MARAVLDTAALSAARGVRAYVGLGSNLGDSVAILKCALRDLDRLPSTRCVGWSSSYRNPPIGPPDQDDYINAVAVLDTRLRPLLLLRWLQWLEQRHGRVRGRRWGARTLDLDLLMFGPRRLRLPRLELPHPRLHQRSFVLCPLAQLVPTVVVPGRGTVMSLRRRCSSLTLTQVSRRGA